MSLFSLKITTIRSCCDLVVCVTLWYLAQYPPRLVERGGSPGSPLCHAHRTGQGAARFWRGKGTAKIVCIGREYMYIRLFHSLCLNTWLLFNYFIFIFLLILINESILINIFLSFLLFPYFLVVWWIIYVSCVMLP